MPKQKLRGKGVINGIAMGKAMLAGKNIDGYLAQYVPDDLAVEREKITGAIQAVAEFLQENCNHLQAEGFAEQAAIMEAHRLMVQDPMLKGAMLQKLLELKAAPLAVLKATKEQAQTFEQMPDPFFKERAVDIRDVGRSVAKYILGVKEQTVGDEAVILCGQEIEPSVIANIPADKIAGIVLGGGSTTCHAVIIAKSRGIPTVVGLGKDVKLIAEGLPMAIDGSNGYVIIEPDDVTLDICRKKIAEQQEREAFFRELKDKPAETTDGFRVELCANIGNPDDVKAAEKYGAEGVGLFRSEFLFMGRETMPDEEEQFQAYKEAVTNCGGKYCVIRTLDVGGDKPLPYLKIPKEDNPFLGWRAVRICLQREELFLTQLKAILRAGAFGPVGIMIPMVVNVSEVKAVKELVAKAKDILRAEKKDFAADVEVGIMIETPAAAVLTPQLAAYVDFFSIGTNDLVQYTLAVDRVNHNVSYLYDHFHPAVLQLVQRTIKAARDRGIWVGMCGEMAADPLAAVLLLAMGITELSMSAPAIPLVKEKIRKISLTEARNLLAEVMNLADGAEIAAYLKKTLA